jgi:hypothetical protein
VKAKIKTTIKMYGSLGKACFDNQRTKPRQKILPTLKVIIMACIAASALKAFTIGANNQESKYEY